MTDISGFILEPLTFPAVTPIAVEGVVQASIIELTLDTEMSPDVRYRLTVSGVTDLHDNVILPPYNKTEFIGFRPPRPVEP